MPVDPALSADWFPLASAEQLASDKPLAARLFGEDLVLWRSDERALAWQDRCLHRGAPVNGEGRSRRRDAAFITAGAMAPAARACTSRPIPTAASHPCRGEEPSSSQRVRPDLGLPGPAGKRRPVFTEWAHASYRKILCGPYDVNAAGPRLIENFWMWRISRSCTKPSWVIGSMRLFRTMSRDHLRWHHRARYLVWQPDPDGMGVGPWYLTPTRRSAHSPLASPNTVAGVTEVGTSSCSSCPSRRWRRRAASSGCGSP